MALLLSKHMVGCINKDVFSTKNKDLEPKTLVKKWSSAKSYRSVQIFCRRIISSSILLEMPKELIKSRINSKFLSGKELSLISFCCLEKLWTLEEIHQNTIRNHSKSFVNLKNNDTWSSWNFKLSKTFWINVKQPSKICWSNFSLNIHTLAKWLNR